MSVLRSLLTAGVLASGLLWSLNGITATPAAQASDDRYEVTQQRNPDAACLDCHKPDTEGMHGKHASVINPNNKRLNGFEGEDRRDPDSFQDGHCHGHASNSPGPPL